MCHIIALKKSPILVWLAVFLSNSESKEPKASGEDKNKKPLRKTRKGLQAVSYTHLLGAAAAAAGMGSDIPLLLGITLFSAVFVFVGNLLANIICSIADPQIREGFDHET